MNFDTIDKLPLHPLVVHAPIVIIPIVTIAIIITSFKPEWHKRFSIPVVSLTAIAFVASYLANESGEYLEERVKETALVHEHIEMAESFLTISFLLTAIVALWAAYPYLVNKITFLKNSEKTIRIIICVATIAFSVFASYQVYQVGHSGARSVWNDTPKTEQGLRSLN